MNAAMLHQRVEAGGWLGHKGIDPLADIKSSPEPEESLRDSWNAITRQDFLPVIEPATLALRAARRTGRLGGLRRALRHLAAEAEQIAETYADMGTDHAGALFNKVMGDQSSDGAFFTRPVAADIAARLALEAIDHDNTLDWSDPDVWRHHKTVDLACGSGTLLAAVMTDMKRRATHHGADHNRLAELQKVAVEEMLKGLDINPVSLQLAATQVMAGNTDIKYRKMGLHLMPYGPQPDGTVAAGSLELFGRKDIVNSGRLFDDTAASTTVETGAEPNDALEGPEMDDAAAAAKNARIVIMNPPFTNRNKMGEKFDSDDRLALRQRTDQLDNFLKNADRSLSEILSKTSLRPRFAALAELCLDHKEGVFATVLPTIALTNSSGLTERLVLADRFHIQTMVTHMGVTDVNFSQGTHREMNESLVVMCRLGEDTKPPTRIISLDRFPRNEAQTADLLRSLNTLQDQPGDIGQGWGEVSLWPAQRVAAGNWAAAVWRSPAMAEAAVLFAEDANVKPLHKYGLSSHWTNPNLIGHYVACDPQDAGAFPLLQSKGADAQTRIEATADGYRKPLTTKSPSIKHQAGHLLLSAGQNVSTARLLAVASDKAYVGVGWTPVSGCNAYQAKALATFINSTAGRTMLMNNPTSSLAFPQYQPGTINALPVPDIHSPTVTDPLAACWDETRGDVVPQYRDGYTPIRRRWDEVVCSALGWEIEQITELGEMLAREPRVRGAAYGQWKP